MTSLSTLPNEILLEIFSKLGYKDLCDLFSVCKKFNKVLQQSDAPERKTPLDYLFFRDTPVKKYQSLTEENLNRLTVHPILDGSVMLKYNPTTDRLELTKTIRHKSELPSLINHLLPCLFAPSRRMYRENPISPCFKAKPLSVGIIIPPHAIWEAGDKEFSTYGVGEKINLRFILAKLVEIALQFAERVSRGVRDDELTRDMLEREANQWKVWHKEMDATFRGILIYLRADGYKPNTIGQFRY